MTLLSRKVYQNIYDVIPNGLIVLDKSTKIVAWNHWLEQKTKFSAKSVYQKSLKELYPKNNFNRFDWALNQVLDYGNPQVLSQALNQYLVPISIDRKGYENVNYMQQNVQILPIIECDEPMALVLIQDVTDKSYERATLLDMAHKLEKKSHIDALTGIYNRHFLNDWVSKYLPIFKKNHTNLVCCMYDLDHFKRVNDEYGHDQGDNVLVSFVDVVRKNLRKDDIFIRYGGEEFLVLLPDLEKDHLTRHANRVIKQMSEKAVHGTLKETITCSAGVSVWDPSQPTSIESLIEKADEALYQAKRQGRNQLCIYSK